MRRFLTVLVAAIGLGMVLSGCVANAFRTTKVKDSYIQGKYIDKVKVPKSKKVGDKNIKFFVGKVKDERKDKAVVVKRMGLGIRTGSTEFANTELSIKNMTKKALLNTGWGVVDNKSNADFVIKTKLKDFAEHMGFFNGWYVTESNICIYNKKSQKIVNKHLYEKDFGSIMNPDLTAQFKFVVGNISVQYYKALIDYFSSPNFINAIKKAYFEMVTEGKN